jgi:hypothetical protein
MNNMLAAITEYWFFSLAFVAASILTVFVCIKAHRASVKARGEKYKIIDRLKYENKTRADFANLTTSLIKTAEPKALFDGIALNIQAGIEEKSDMNAAFEKLTIQQQYIYALYYVLLDGSKKLSEFFKMNGKPLTPIAGEAVRLIFGRKVGDLYSEEYAAYDDDNEETSLIPAEVQAQDQAFAALMAQQDVYALVTGYIKQNAEHFIAK